MHAGRGLSWLGAVAVAAIVTIGHRQLLQPVGLTTRDHTDSYLRVQQYVQELADGHWPQTLPDAIAGGGHAFPRYYPPLSQWAPVGMYAIHPDVIAATHLSGMVAIVLAALTCYFSLQLLGAGLLPAVVASTLYALFPYTWVALDIRGAFAETWALVFYPLILAGLILSLRQGTPVRWLAPAVAGAVAAHLVLTAWALSVLIPVAVATGTRGLQWEPVRRVATTALIGIGLMAFFFLPSLIEADGLRVGDPSIVWATPEALAATSWAFYESVFRTFRWWDELEWALLCLGLLGMWQTRDGKEPEWRLACVALTGFAASAILVRAPVEVWRVVPQPLRYIQFPERLLGIAGLLLAVTLGSAASNLRSNLGRIVLAGLGGLVVLYAARLGGQILPRSGETSEEVLERLETQYPDRGLTVVGEYLPRGSVPESLAASIRRSREIAGSPPLLSWERERGGYRAVIRQESAGESLLPLVGYSFYRVRTGATPISTGTSAGQLSVSLGPGTHELMIERRWPPSSIAGLLISLLSIVVYFAWSRPAPDASSALQKSPSEARPETGSLMSIE